MIDQSEANQYQIPPSPKELATNLDIPELTPAERALRDAQEVAHDARPLDTLVNSSYDRIKVGAATITHVTSDSSPVPERAYDPTHPRDLLSVGKGIQAMRTAKLGS